MFCHLARPRGSRGEGQSGPQVADDRAGRAVQVHVALVGEWDDAFKRSSQAGAAADNPNVDTIKATKGQAPKPDINLVFSFRGTEPWNACNWLADFDYEWRPVRWWSCKSAVVGALRLFPCTSRCLQ